MSDIPDWLVELAAQQDEEDDEDEGTPEWDFLRSEDAIEEEAPAPVLVGASAVFPDEPVEPAGGEEEDLDEDALIHTLRSQVEIDEEEATRVPSSSTGPRFQILGLLPWQQLVLAVLLLLDVAVIGLLFLVMFGKVSFG